MSGTFVVLNQLGHYWGKSGAWVSGTQANLVACWKYRDEAVNTLFELGSKDTELRGEVFEAEAESGQPKNLVVSEHPVPVDTRENSGEPYGSPETPSAEPN